jgi:ribose 5-phosphate isomerase B
LYDEMKFATSDRIGEKAMRIAIASDHAGFQLKEEIKKTLESMGISYDDFGTKNTESVDYPDYAGKVARAVQNGSRGILCCGTGIGMSIAANKFKGVRAAVCNDVFTAQMSREHNDSNVLILGGRIIQDPGTISEIVKVWIETGFEGGRHQRRLDKIKEFEGQHS